MKKRFLVFLMISLLVMGTLSGCGNNGETTTGGDGEIVIGVAGVSFSDKWQTYLHDAMREAADELGVKLIETDGKDDAATQLTNVENLITQGVDAIVIAIVDPQAPEAIVKACKDNNVPLIGVNRVFEGYDAYVGSESIQAGLMQMEAVAELLGNKGNIGILRGMAGNESEIMRTQGNKDIVAKHPELKVIAEEIGNWDRAQGMEIMENWLQSGEEFNAIVSNNDEMAIGAIRALEAAGKLDEVVVAGVDATLDALKYVEEGKLDITIFQNPFGQGRGALEAAVKLANGESVEKEEWVPYELVTKDNVEKYIKIWENK